MRTRLQGPGRRVAASAWLVCASVIALGGCPQTTPPQETPPANTAPVAKVGEDQVVAAGALVTLDGSASSDPDGDPLSFAWKQTAGTAVSLSGAAGAVVTFTAPGSGTALIFELEVSDGLSSSTADSHVSVQPPAGPVQIIERRQPSIRDDPAVTGKFPDVFAFPTLPPGPIEPGKGAADWINQITHAPVVDEELPAGATRQVEMQVAGPSILMGLAKWIGTAEPLPLTLSLDGTTVATGRTYGIGTNRGGSDARTKTAAGGRVVLSLSNTTDSAVKVEIILGAAAAR